jgi:hypothetical protein
MMDIINEKGKTYTITAGMANALKKGEKLKWKRVCERCGFNMPSYSGPYPKNCPICAAPFNTANEEYMIYQEDGYPIGSVVKNKSLTEAKTYLVQIGDPQSARTVEIIAKNKSDAIKQAEAQKKAGEWINPYVRLKNESLNEANEAAQLDAAKKWIIKNISITGKIKKDPDELNAMKSIMKIKSIKELWSTLENKYLFDKHQLKQLKMDLVDVMMGESEQVDETSFAIGDEVSVIDTKDIHYSHIGKIIDTKNGKYIVQFSNKTASKSFYNANQLKLKN